MTEPEDGLKALEERVAQLEQRVKSLETRIKKKAGSPRSGAAEYRERYDTLAYPEER